MEEDLASEAVRHHGHMSAEEEEVCPDACIPGQERPPLTGPLHSHGNSPIPTMVPQDMFLNMGIGLSQEQCLMLHK